MIPERPVHTWFRFTGRLWEDLTFEPGVGWETDVVARRPRAGDGTWALELLDAEGRVILDVSPDVRFSHAAGGGRMPFARVVAYLPVHAQGRRVRLRRRDHVVYERALPASSPSVRITRCELDDDRHVTLAWEATAGPRLAYRVVYVAEGRGVFPLARDLSTPELRVPLSRLPGSPAGRFAVLASDGLRSGFDVSDAIAVPARPARVAIVEPEPRLVVPFGQPVTLRGVAHDDAGRRLDETGFVWTLDGQAFAREQHLVLATGLRAGEHTVVLAWEGAGAPRAETRVQFVVSDLEVAELPPPTRPVERGVEAGTRATVRIKL